MIPYHGGVSGNRQTVPSSPTRTGRPPLTERRKAATRVEIAREAVRLFGEKGVAATSADEIAAAAGISVRTLWRYFPTKEACVRPVLSTGIDQAVQGLRDWPPGKGMAELSNAMERSGEDMLPDVPILLGLVRLTRTEPGLRAVWLQAHDDAEPLFAAALAERAGRPGDDLEVRVQAAMINAALRAAVEQYAWRTDPDTPSEVDEEGILAAVRAALQTVARGVPR